MRIADNIGDSTGQQSCLQKLLNLLLHSLRQVGEQHWLPSLPIVSVDSFAG